MAYTAQKKEQVKELIERYTNEYLERYTQADVIKKAEDAMEDNQSSIAVADAVYDYMYTTNKADIVISTAVKQCIPASVLFLLRQDIIKILN